MLKRIQKNQKGFTLVELLAVIVILGIILAIAIPAIGNVIEKSENDAHDANVELFENAARLAHVSGVAIDASVQGYTLSTLESNGFLEEIPEDPKADGAKYSGNSFVKVNEGANGKVTFTYSR
ncbi:prepilin-type N-terminal cleavage/methylation domain-containing protein [Ornithinibacillus scapharcae]|uniref:prepilin-type N-terminal cleavage/methylation domain-containing protein n=1 Tax=Ornithinibacillus scapharcae TaxID=1147159 RepID=UPI000225C185|nr:prepilin-type N-terminal cleavage/methylation domain-containing protein [Ornithinibacillus scapharcae]